MDLGCLWFPGYVHIVTTTHRCQVGTHISAAGTDSQAARGGYENRLGHQLWVQDSAPTFPSCVILGTLLNFYEPQFLHQENEGKSGISLVACL